MESKTSYRKKKSRTEEALLFFKKMKKITKSASTVEYY